MKDNLIQKLSYNYALDIIKVCMGLVKEKEFVLSRQLLRSGTAIGANIEEAIGDQSRKDFVAKMSIAYKEARETFYRLRLMKDSGFLKANLADDLLNKCQEILKILVSILKTTKNNS